MAGAMAHAQGVHYASMVTQRWSTRHTGSLFDTIKAVTCSARYSSGEASTSHHACRGMDVGRAPLAFFLLVMGVPYADLHYHLFDTGAHRLMPTLDLHQ